MQKNILLGGVVIGIVVMAAVAIMMQQSPDPSPVIVPVATTTPSTTSGLDPRNATYQIASSTVTLTNGIAISDAAPGSATKITTRYFGNEAQGDLNGDDFIDHAFLITQDMGGTGTFFYAVVALGAADGTTHLTNTFLVGDRIAPQSTEIHSDSHELHINYAERKPGEPMTTPPSQGAVLLLKVTPAGVLEGLMK